MTEIFETSLPVESPVLVFSIVLFTILIAPMVFERLKVPGIIGLIIAGAIIGPNGLHFLNRDGSIVLLGTVGLLFIMFLAGLEIDLNEFKKNKNKSLSFGSLTFLIPMTLGTLAGVYLLNLELMPSLLLASMFASHTLLTYPLIQKLGIVKSRSVNIAVGGTIITDLAALLVLAIIAGMATGDIGSAFWIGLTVKFLLFAFIVLWGFPKVAKWFFKNVAGDNGSKFIFVLCMVFIAAFIAEEAGLEPIIGAFLAGLAMNRTVSTSKNLMGKIHFVGNTLFIPIFLLSVGMLIDYKILFSGPEALLVALTMIVIATFSKWFAAYLTQKFLGFSKNERNIIFGLSNAQAAATLAAVMVGYNLGLLNESILNGTILMILVTCMVSSFVTQNAAKNLAAKQNAEAELEKVFSPLLENFPQVSEIKFDKKNSQWVITDKMEQNNKMLVSAKKKNIDFNEVAASIFSALIKKDKTEVKIFAAAIKIGVLFYTEYARAIMKILKQMGDLYMREFDLLVTKHFEAPDPTRIQFEPKLVKYEENQIQPEQVYNIIDVVEAIKVETKIEIELMHPVVPDLTPADGVVVPEYEIYLNSDKDPVDLRRLSELFDSHTKIFEEEVPVFIENKRK
jgi:Kef-type K+ transport system membrane component KefB